MDIYLAASRLGKYTDKYTNIYQYTNIYLDASRLGKYPALASHLHLGE